MSKEKQESIFNIEKIIVREKGKNKRVPMKWFSFNFFFRLDSSLGLNVVENRDEKTFLEATFLT